MDEHTIIYLDQNYLSNMAKAQLNQPVITDKLRFWLSLFANLKKEVLADKIACPKSEFHREESSYDRRKEKSILETSNELSCGLEFKPWDEILQIQVEEAAYRFLGKEPPEKQWWEIAFHSDPRASVESRLEDITGNKVSIDYLFTEPDIVIEHKRRIKRRWPQIQSKELLRKSSRIWEYELQAHKQSFVFMYLGPPAILSYFQEFGDNQEYEIQNRNAKFIEDLNRFIRLINMGINTFEFFNSDEILNIPFIDIFCSITAALKLYYHKRVSKASDLNDFAILATAIPYCDIATTDSFMKELLTQIHIDDKYECKLFSATKTDFESFYNLI
jgi:hypothetical protein